MDQAKKMAIKQAFWDRERLCRIKSDVPLIEELTQSRFLSQQNSLKYIQQNIMSLSFKNALMPLLPHHKEVLSEYESLNMEGKFFVAADETNVMLGCTQNYLILSHVSEGIQNSYFCPLNFDLKFEILRRQWPDAKTPGIPFGIKFQRGPLNISFQVINSNPSIISSWGFYLSRKINQRNFHQLFKAKKKIGRGAFASVYLAERLSDKKMVAVKAFCKEKQFSGQKGKQSLENQIRIMRSIDHPNIGRLQEVYETENSIYVILECLKGKQLNEVIKSGRKFSTEEVASMLRQLLSGLAHLSSKRIIHRDIKPQNIMFKYEEGVELSICDFGLATHADAQKYLFVRCGTPGYVSPEIINIKDMQTKSQPISDVFSAGVIFHLLLLGRSVFPGHTNNQVISQNRTCLFNFNTQDYQKLDPQTRHLLFNMLQKNPLKRITAQNALTHDFFKLFNSGMDIEEPQKKPFMEIWMNQNLQQSSKPEQKSMMEEEQNLEMENSPFVSSVIKKKPSFMINSSFVEKKGQNFQRIV